MELGLGYELHVFQFGPHGYALADATTADGSSQVLDDAFAQWHELSVKWLLRTFGKLEFADKSTSKMAGIMAEMGLIPQKQVTHG
jgi:predicted PolB exonuclease-like 3'-5' exonuclease